MPKLMLFDVDGTLILSGGAGIRGMNRAFEEVFGVEGAFNNIPVSGRTDRVILQDALATLGRQMDDATCARFCETYYRWLQREIVLPGPRKGIMPGVSELLNELSRRHDVFLALLTGNFSEAARIKLEYFNLWRYFACGAYADDAADRNALVEVAVGRARERGAPVVTAADVWVIGDTPLDVACARSAGARAIAVATGPYSADDLRRSGADLVLEDLGDSRAFLALLDSAS
ncbi:MAG: HAD hydrolase-like protein [Acidobacteria bacterium]|nr:HAD hydrolase-like protein [Acidobacteriota bacterium]